MCSADRYDPLVVFVLVDELTDQRCTGSHSRARNLLRAGLTASLVLVQEGGSRHNGLA